MSDFIPSAPERKNNSALSAAEAHEKYIKVLNLIDELSLAVSNQQQRNDGHFYRGFLRKLDHWKKTLEENSADFIDLDYMEDLLAQVYRGIELIFFLPWLGQGGAYYDDKAVLIVLFYQKLRDCQKEVEQLSKNPENIFRIKREFAASKNICMVLGFLVLASLFIAVIACAFSSVFIPLMPIVALGASLVVLAAATPIGHAGYKAISFLSFNPLDSKKEELLDKEPLSKEAESTITSRFSQSFFNRLGFLRDFKGQYRISPSTIV